MKDKVYKLERYNYLTNEYNEGFLFEAPIMLTISKLFNENIKLVDDENTCYRDITRNEKCAEYTVCTKQYEHLGIYRELYREKITCYDFDNITEEEINYLEENYLENEEGYLGYIYAENEKEIEKKVKEIDKKIYGMEANIEKGYYVILEDYSLQYDVYIHDFAGHIGNMGILSSDMKYESFLESFDQA